jgi:hypothetical protein
MSTGRIRWYEYGGYIPVLRAAAPGGNGFSFRGWGSLLAKFVPYFWLFAMGLIGWADPFRSCPPTPTDPCETYCVTLFAQYQHVARLT